MRTENLYTPTDKAADAMLSLGLETSDAEGNMKPLNEVLKDLDASLGGMSDADRAKILAEMR
ncbi:MAG: phage tail tape measure protein [Blautia sp.]|nr:phage tail tape measure protein [Blautia sp.]